MNPPFTSPREKLPETESRLSRNESVNTAIEPTHPETPVHSERPSGFLKASGVEFSVLSLAIGLISVVMLILLGLNDSSVEFEASAESGPEVIELPVIPLPEGDVGGVREEATAPQE